MKNKIFAALTILVLCLSLIISVSAAGLYVVDDTSVIGQLDSVETMAQKIEETYGFSVLLSIIAEAPDESGTVGYCQKLYENNAATEDGIALTYNYGAQEFFFYRSGQAQEIFSYEILNGEIWDSFAHKETYYDAAVAYYTAVEAFLKKSDLPVAETTTPETEDVTEDTVIPLVTDNADLLSDAEEKELTLKLEALGEKYDLEIAVLTVDTFNGADGQTYAQNYFTDSGYGVGEEKNGVILAFNTGENNSEREIVLVAHGPIGDEITDLERDVIFEMIIPLLKNGEYAAAFETFIDEVDGAMKTGTPLYIIPLSLVLGFAVAFIIVKIQASRLKTVRKQVNAESYVGNVVLTYRSDNFMYRNVRTSPRAKSSSSQGGSSGGFSGGSKKF